MKNDLSQKMHGNVMLSGYSVKMIFLCHTNMISWTYRKHHGNMMFSVYLVKIVFLFLQIWNYPSVEKSKDDLFPKNKPKDDISTIPEKGDTYPRKDDIGILR